jgi:hypothetical protein
MKLLKRLSLFAVVVAFVLTLASCGKINQKYADKVNEAAEAGEHYTYDQVMEDLGDEAVWVGGELLGSHTGIIYAVKGCKSWDEIEDKIDEGKTVKGITIVITANKAVSAKYSEITEESEK